MAQVERLRGASCLITGGLGFIGSNLAMRLVELGARVTLVDSLDERFGGNLANIDSIRERVTWTIADLADTAAVEAAVDGQAFIFHLAGQVNHQRSMAAPRFDWECNCLPTINLLEACRSRNVHARILFTSTRQVYARATSLPVDETHSTQPHDVNAVHKLAAEHYLSVYERSYGIRSTVLRLTNTYGPRQKIACAGQGVAGYFVFQALRGAVLRLYGGGGQRRDFNYVDDVVEAMLLAITTDDCLGEVFNLGAETSHSLREYLDVLREFCVFEVQEVPFPPSAATIEIGDYQGDYGRLRRVCGWSPRIGLQEGLRRTTEFYRAHPQAYGL